MFACFDVWLHRATTIFSDRCKHNLQNNMASPEASVHPVKKSSLLSFRRLPNERKLFTEMFKKDNVA